MNVLVTAASRHGATREIAEAIAEGLVADGLEAHVHPPDEVTDLTGVDAVVIGSSVYAGHWLDAAKRFVDRHATALRTMPVWLFSSGPIGDPPKPQEDPVDVADVLVSTGACDHRLFAGRLERSRLGFAEKAIVVALRAPEGDFRDWDAIHGWTADISDMLAHEAAAGR